MASESQRKNMIREAMKNQLSRKYVTSDEKLLDNITPRPFHEYKNRESLYDLLKAGRRNEFVKYFKKNEADNNFSFEDWIVLKVMTPEQKKKASNGPLSQKDANEILSRVDPLLNRK